MKKDKRRSFVIPEEIDEKMFKIAKVRHITHSQAYRDAVDFFISNWEYFYSTREIEARTKMKLGEMI